MIDRTLIKFLRCARYPSIMDASATYKKLFESTFALDRDFDIGMVNLIYSGVATILVHALEPLPDDVAALVDVALFESGELFEAPQELIDCVLLRRARQVAMGETTTVVRGGQDMAAFAESGFRYIDQYGQNIA